LYVLPHSGSTLSRSGKSVNNWRYFDFFGSVLITYWFRNTLLDVVRV